MVHCHRAVAAADTEEDDWIPKPFLVPRTSTWVSNTEAPTIRRPLQSHFVASHTSSNLLFSFYPVSKLADLRSCLFLPPLGDPIFSGRGIENGDLSTGGPPTAIQFSTLPTLTGTSGLTLIQEMEHTRCVGY